MKLISRTEEDFEVRVAHRITLVKKETGKNLSKDLNEQNVLKRAIKLLKKHKSTSWKSVADENCLDEDLDEDKIDQEAKLRCRQLPIIINELRKSLMRQDWDGITTLLMILCHPGMKYYSPVILKVCFILLLNHPYSNFDLIHNFIRFTSEYVLQEDVEKLTMILFALKKIAIIPLGSGKFVRKTGDYKVVRDVEFETL